MRFTSEGDGGGFCDPEPEQPDPIQPSKTVTVAVQRLMEAVNCAG